ncbi:hypothetical protein [Neisseria sicca]|nr:hypothetical protein [Neisseria sicca]
MWTLSATIQYRIEKGRLKSRNTGLRKLAISVFRRPFYKGSALRRQTFV